MSILIHNCTAVLMDEAGTVLPNAYVVVEGTKIRSVSTQRPWGSFEEQIDGRGNVLMPGFVNAHSHVPMTAMRGYGDGNNLQDWLHNYIFPVEARWDDRAIRACTDLGLAEMIASGVTTIADMYGHTDAVAQEVAASGISANLCCGGVQFTDTFDPATHHDCVVQRELTEKWHGYNDGQILVDASIHGEYTSHHPLWQWMGGLRPGARPGYARAHLRDPHRACRVPGPPRQDSHSGAQRLRRVGRAGHRPPTASGPPRRTGPLWRPRGFRPSTIP